MGRADADAADAPVDAAGEASKYGENAFEGAEPPAGFDIKGNELGAKSITETAVTGWTLTDLDCTGDADAVTSLANRKADLDVDAGEDITCTFENTKDAKVTIVKDAVPDHAQDFDFDGTGAGIADVGFQAEEGERQRDERKKDLDDPLVVADGVEHGGCPCIQ